MLPPDRSPHRLPVTELPSTEPTATQLAAIERHVQRRVGEELQVALVPGPEPGGGGAVPGRREQEFRLGRKALGRVLESTGSPLDPLQVRFPHPALSVSHSGHTAAAVARRSGTPAGLGIDVELRRAVDVRAARYFLADDEEVPETADRLHQLWTIKEAVFKADLDNAGRLLRDYEVRDIHHQREWTEGTASRGALAFWFRSFVLAPLILTVAARERTTS